jgi:hypothetical protein
VSYLLLEYIVDEMYWQFYNFVYLNDIEKNVEV